ncbi:MAG TPA: alpha/beta hydrolase [Anaerolineales bacterium]|nr:alpha/beta hydrolase [Anaerolineales bacterium]
MPTAASLYYFAHEANNRSRPPVVLIHGAGGSHLSWPPHLRRLPDQRIFAPDLPAHGKSEGIGHHAVEDYVHDLFEFLSELKIYSAILVGHSMGSAVALSAAIHFPERIIALGLIGSGARLRVAPDLLHAASDPSTFESAVQMIHNASFSSQSSRTRELSTQRMLETRPTVLYGDLLACDAFDVMDQLLKLSLPTLIVCGSDDRMTPLRYSEFLRDHIAGARLEVVPQAGHMVMLEQPDLVSNLLADFFDSIAYPP